MQLTVALVMLIIGAISVFVFMAIHSKRQKAENAPRNKVGVVTKTTMPNYKTYSGLKDDLTTPVLLPPPKNKEAEPKKRIADLKIPPHPIFDKEPKKRQKLTEEHENQTKFERNEHYKIVEKEENNTNAEISSILQSPDSLRNSFIINEIFSKKYFD
ncbi:MAG: hypothetical protein EAZ57_09720 [Cytophagales bacterium]|nr:MAG: hypothetical protein EAZ67_10230 [Cytophagales bacterium]TAF59813.1 MAG: hypothetical protein EAZ57_09720 [Cytophagales bacterium]